LRDRFYDGLISRSYFQVIIRLQAHPHFWRAAKEPRDPETHDRGARRVFREASGGKLLVLWRRLKRKGRRQGGYPLEVTHPDGRAGVRSFVPFFLSLVGVVKGDIERVPLLRLVGYSSDCQPFS
jgi:hypothetical protein